MKYYEDKSDRKMELKLLPLSEDDKLIRECMEQASAFYGCLGKMGVTEILCDRKKAQELGADCQITGIFTGGELTAFACAFEYTGLKRNGRKWLNPGDKEWRQIETLGTNVVVIPLLVGKEKVGRLIELLREQYRDSHLLFRISGEQSEKFQEDLAVVSEKNLKSHRYDAAGENVWLFHFAPQIRMEDTYFEEEILLILPGQEVLLEMGIEEAEVTMVKLTGYEIVRSEKGSAFFRKPGAACEGVLLQCDYEQLLRYQRFINLTNYEEHFEQTDRGKALIYSEKYMKELTEFWVSVLTLAINRIPASSLQAYRLYKLGMEASEEELERLLNKRLNRMESVYDFVQERMKMKAELSFEEDDILVPEQKIPVHFDGSSGKELYINTSKIGLSRDCPKDELFTWIMEITEKKRQINQFLKAPRRAIDKASQHLKGRAESFFGDEYKMDQFQVEDLEAEIERLETNVLENSTSGLVDEAKFKEQIETVDKKVKKDIVSHIRRSTAVQVGCCLLLVYLLGFVPYWISAAKLGGSQFGSAVVVALAALAVAAAGGIAALFILRHRVRMSMEEYNHVIHTMVNNVNASADEFGKYFTAVCTYMKAQSIRAGIKLKSESISSAQFILRAHKQALKSSIERDEEVAASYGIRRVAEVEKNITSFFHEEKLPKDNALYYYETDKSDVGIPLNEAGDLVRAPYKFVAKLKLEREDLYDEVKGEV